MNTPFIPAPSWEFVEDDVLFHWFLNSSQQHRAQMGWQDHVEDPFR